MNFSALVYPAKSDFDNWVTLMGDEIWNGDNMALYLKRSNKYKKPHAEFDKALDGGLGGRGGARIRWTFGSKLY